MARCERPLCTAIGREDGGCLSSGQTDGPGPEYRGSDRSAWTLVRLLVDVVSAAASFESRRIGERAKSVHAVRRSQGKRAGQAPLLSDDVRLRIAREHAEGKSLNAIAVALNGEGVPTARGGKWHASTIRHVVHSVEVDNELAKIRSGVPA